MSLVHEAQDICSAPVSRTVARRDRVPSIQKAAYGVGIVSDHCSIFGITAFAMPIFNVMLGLSPTMVGFALGIARLWDAFLDPFVGILSDNRRNLNGRRKPFLFLGSILTGCAFPFIWFVPEGLSQASTFAFLLVSLLFFYTCYSVFSVPYQSLGMELTASYLERTNVYSWMSSIQQVSGFIVPWLLTLAMLPAFGNAMVGAKWVGAGVGVIIIITGILPAVLCKERYQTVAKKQQSDSIIASFKSITKNRPIRLVIFTIGIFLVPGTIVHSFDFYLNTYYLYEGDIKGGSWFSGVDGTLKVAFALLGIFVIRRLSKTYDKHLLIRACILILILGRVGIYFTYIPGNPLLALTFKPLLSMAETGFWVLILSMRADLADWDEYESGRRREGMIAAATNTAAKIAMTIAILLTGPILQYFVGFDRELGGEQPAGTLDKLFWATLILPFCAHVIIFYLLKNYPLTYDKYLQIRANLERRREAV
ncbi:MFS transporter [Pelagicoccus mobilis]|uniref:MFS transporter n=1 Tax=Pelagicoccus mobilis TaxID=415221 RepID=A0A934S2S4_9BACT|nr:MFS transporter [Pelagicoccus mobilis]MBK1880034.1 MFS transporter [Pelagicoccus mobilis]